MVLRQAVLTGGWILYVVLSLLAVASEEQVRTVEGTQVATAGWFAFCDERSGHPLIGWTGPDRCGTDGRQKAQADLEGHLQQRHGGAPNGRSGLLQADCGNSAFRVGVS